MAAEDATTSKSPDAGAVEPVKVSTTEENAIASSDEAAGDDASKSTEEKVKNDESAEEGKEVSGDEKDATKKDASDEPAADGDAAAVATEVEKTPATPATNKKKGGAKTPKTVGKKKSQANLKRKATGGATAADTKYEVGQYVLAKMRSFPPWPAIVLSKELLPEIMAVKPTSGNSKSLETLGDAAWNTQYPIFYMGTYEYSWIAASDLEVLSKEKIERGAGSKKAKKLNEAFAEAAEGFSLEDVKSLQEEVMDLDEEEVKDEETEIAEPSVDEDEMEVDEDEDASSDEKPKKKKAARGKKRKKSESASDDEAESEKPAKTPKKAAASKAKTPKAAASSKTPMKPTPTPAKSKTPKTPANGVKTASKKAAASAAKDKASPPATASKKKAVPAKKKTAAKSKDVVESEDSEAEKSDEQSSTDPRTLSAEDQHKYILHRRHKLQKAFLNKDKTPPMEEEMAELSKWLTSLEEWDDMPADLIKSTKIHKVLRGIMNVEFTIPQEDTYTFKARSEPLHAKWVETIRNADKAAKIEESNKTADESAKEDEEVVKENGVNGEADDKKTVKEAEKAGLPAAAADVSDAGVEMVERKAETLVLTEVAMKDAPAASAATVSSAEKEDGSAADSKADAEEV